jgi:hypothetical protein
VPGAFLAMRLRAKAATPRNSSIVRVVGATSPLTASRLITADAIGAGGRYRILCLPKFSPCLATSVYSNSYALCPRALPEGLLSSDSEAAAAFPCGLLTAYRTSSTRFEIPNLSKIRNR